MTTAFLTCVTPLTPHVLRLLDQCPHTSFIFMGCCLVLDFLGHLQVWKAADRGVYHRPWPKSMLQLEDHLRFGHALSQEQEAAVVLQHHVPVESPLCHIQMLPFIPGEVHSNVFK